MNFSVSFNLLQECLSLLSISFLNGNSKRKDLALNFNELLLVKTLLLQHRMKVTLRFPFVVWLKVVVWCPARVESAFTMC